MLDAMNVALLGAGNMAEAIVRGLLHADEGLRSRIAAADISPDRRRVFQDSLGVKAEDDGRSIIPGADLVVLAVKPQSLPGLLDDVGSLLTSDHVVLSIVAGVRIADIERRCGPGVRVVRAMPNTPLLVREGASAVAPGSNATRNDLDVAKELLGAAGKVVEVDEGLLDAVTALSGSGPAYFFYLVEGLVSAAEELGLTHETAVTLTAQTMLGAARLLQETALPPGELRRRVTSPGGTTAAAITAFDDADLKSIIRDAVQRAARRSSELADEFAR